MQNNPVGRRCGVVAAVLFLVMAASGCGAEVSPAMEEPSVAVGESVAAETDSVEQQVGNGESSEPAGEGDGEYVFGLERDKMVEVVESTYGARNAKARWEDDRLVVAMEGDALEDDAGFTDCRVLTQLLNDGDLVTMEYPNGDIDCELALEDE